MESAPSSIRARIRSMTQVSNHQLMAQLHQLNEQGFRLDAELLLYLGELDRRGLYRQEACGSAFEFCISRMGYSEGVAYKRVGAARLMRQFPRIYELLAEGQIHLTAVMLLKPHLTEENHEQWLLAASHKSRRQVEKLLASRCPKPDVEASVRKLPGKRPAPGGSSPESPADGEDRPAGSPQQTPVQQTPVQQTSAPTTPALETVSATRGATDTTVTPATPALAPSTHAVAQVAPLSGSTYRVTFTASEQLKQKLDRARELLSHCIAPSDLPALIERALDQLLEREQRRRYGTRPKCKLTAPLRPRRPCPAPPQGEKAAPLMSGEPASARSKSASAPSVDSMQQPCQVTAPERLESQDPNPKCVVNAGSTSSTSRRRPPPAAVRQEVFERDGGQCTFVDQQGRRCTSLSLQSRMAAAITVSEWRVRR